MSLENLEKINKPERLTNAVDQNVFHSGQLRFDKIIASFDFKELDNLTNDLARNVGCYDTSPHSLGRDSFYELTTTDKKGNYGDKHIGLRVRTIEQHALEAGIDPEKLAVQVIIHEQTHAISDQRSELGRQVGFYRRKGDLPTAYELWNEGVTEKLAREIYRKYALVKHIATGEEIDMYMEKVREYGRDANELYQPEVDLVEGFIGRVAKEVGVDSALVWKAIVQGLLRGDEWYASEFKELANDILPPNFMHDIEGMDAHKTAQRLTQELLEEKVKGAIRASKIVRKIKRALEKHIEFLNN